MTHGRLRPAFQVTVIAVVILVVKFQVGRVQKQDGVTFSTNEESSKDEIGVGKNRQTKVNSDIQIGENCNLAEAHCTYFNPIQFVRRTWFEWMNDGSDNVRNSDSIQFGYAYDIDEMCYKHEGALTAMSPMKCLDGKENDAFCTPPRNGGHFDSVEYRRLPARFTFKHTQNSGGDMIYSALLGLLHYDSPMYSMQHVQYELVGEKEDINGIAEDTTFTIEQDQVQNGPRAHPVIAVVRDPVERFLSASAQALREDTKLREKCGNNKKLDNSGRLSCILSEVEGGLFLVQLVPMVADFYCGVRGHEIRMSLYNFDELPQVLKAFGYTHDGDQGNTEKTYLSYSDLDEAMLLRICRLYISDVLMMRSLGYEVPGCPQ